MPAMSKEILPSPHFWTLLDVFINIIKLRQCPQMDIMVFILAEEKTKFLSVLTFLRIL